MKYITFIISFFFVNQVFCQIEQLSFFYNSNWELTSKENSKFYRKAEFNVNELIFSGKVYDYDTDGNLLMQGYYTGNKKNGEFSFFYPKGNLESKGEYKNNKRYGKWIYYYENGNLRQEVVFSDDGNRHNFSVVNFFDRSGKQLVVDGNGKWINDSIPETFTHYGTPNRLEGKFVNGLKHGAFALFNYKAKRIVHSERFRKGVLVDSKFYSPAAKTYIYGSIEFLNKIPDKYRIKFLNTEKYKLDTSVHKTRSEYADIYALMKILKIDTIVKNRNAGYEYGDYSLLEFIAQNIRFPEKAIAEKRSGIVYVSICIDEKGIANSYEILKGVCDELDNEALRVARLINNWLPKIVDGVPVESTITIPIRFLSL
jgi:TonB family protein